MEQKLIHIVRQFQNSEKIINIFPFGSGHINDTFKVETEVKNYLLQRINHQIFENVEGLTQNLIKVTQHLHNKNSKPDYEILNTIPLLNGEALFKDDSGDSWRLFDFIEDSISYDLVENTKLALEGGKAYGNFIKLLDDFPAETLIEIIPDFHNMDFRLNNFYNSVEVDVADRVKTVRSEIEFIKNRVIEMSRIRLLGLRGSIPLRVTHNDTKINNVLFNEDGHAKCVIDLDTVMPGYIHYDFGDAIRTFTNTALEDEKDLNKVSINMEYFEAFSKGFLSETNQVLNSIEIENLAFSAKLMTYIIGLRFLTDYLDGDIYYKTKYPEHNLQRARVQFKLLKDMEDQFMKMQNIILSLVQVQ